jgi:hypothetical protein
MTGGVRLAVVGTVFACVALGGCSKKAPAPPAPTEQEIHASDSGVTSGRVGRHPYRCDDGQPLFVDFRDSGLQIDLRLSEDGRPMIFTAPAQGLQYLGDAGGVVLHGSKLITDGPGIGNRTCSREGWQ